MSDRDHDLSIVRQVKALGVARSSVYYEPRPVSAEDMQLMRRLDELHLDHPFAGEGCCAIFCGARASSWAAGMSRR